MAREEFCTRVAELDVLRDLMAPVEAGKEEEDEIAIQDEEAEQDAEPLRLARGPNPPSQEYVGCNR